jgi:hypothetical protein
MWRYFFWEENRKWRWRFCFGAPLYAFVFIYFEPLKGNIVNYQYPIVYNFIPLFATILLVYISNFTMPKLFPNFFKKETWTLKRFYFWFISFAITGTFIAYIFDINVSEVNNKLAWSIDYLIFYQIPVSCFVYAPMLAFFIFFDPYPYLNEKPIIQIEGENLNTVKLEETILPVKDANERVELSVNLERLYFFKASDNYIEIFHKNTEGVIRVVIRNTLKNIENQFLDIPQLFRCHKAFIVNTEKVREVNGNAKGYFLTLEDVEEKIPVSRSNIEAMKKCLPTFFE